MVDFVVGGREDTWRCVLRGVIAVVRTVITVPDWIIGFYLWKSTCSPEADAPELKYSIVKTFDKIVESVSYAIIIFGIIKFINACECENM